MPTSSRVYLTSDIEHLGLKGLAGHMDAQGDIAFSQLLQTTGKMPSPKTATRHVFQALTTPQMPHMIRASLALPAQRERLRVRLDEVPVKTFEGTAWFGCIEVSGRLNLAALLGLPGVEPVVAVHHLVEAWERLEGFWGPEPTTSLDWHRRNSLQIVKLSDAMNARGFQWVGDQVAPGADNRFAEVLAGDPRLADWLRVLQKGLAAMRIGPHSWLTLVAKHFTGDARMLRLMEREYREEQTAKVEIRGDTEAYTADMRRPPPRS